MLLERPDAVVAHHADDRQAVAHEAVELHPREAEGAVAEQQADLPVRVRDLRGERVARARPEAAVRARVHPAARLVGLDHAAGERDEVAAVADHDRVAVEHLVELVVDAQRVQRRAVVGQVGLLARALLVLDLAQLGRPAASGRGRRRRPRAARPASPPRRRTAPPPPRAGAAAPAAPSRSRRPAVSSPNEPPKPSLKSIGTPIDERQVGALEAGPARAREEHRVVGGHAAARQPVEEDGHRQLLAEPHAAPARRAPSRGPVPAITTGLLAERSSSAARSSASPSAAGTASGSGSEAGPSASASDSMKTWSSGKSTKAGPVGAFGGGVQRLVDQAGDLGRRLRRAGQLGHRLDERDVVDLLERALAPPERGRAPAEHDHRRAVLERRRHAAHPVGHARARRSAPPRPARASPSPSPRRRTPRTARGARRRCRRPRRGSRRRSRRGARPTA